MRIPKLKIRTAELCPGGTMEFLSEIPITEGMISVDHLLLALDNKVGVPRIRSGNRIPDNSRFIVIHRQ